MWFRFQYQEIPQYSLRPGFITSLRWWPNFLPAAVIKHLQKSANAGEKKFIWTQTFRFSSTTSGGSQCHRLEKAHTATSTIKSRKSEGVCAELLVLSSVSILTQFQIPCLGSSAISTTDMDLIFSHQLTYLNDSTEYLQVSPMETTCACSVLSRWYLVLSSWCLKTSWIPVCGC